LPAKTACVNLSHHRPGATTPGSGRAPDWEEISADENRLGMGLIVKDE